MIILFGVVGSGKSEQAKRLLARLNCPYISTSHLLRENLTPERQARMLAGKLVPDDEVLSLLGPALQEAKAGTVECILDGAPRSIAQAQWLIDKMRSGEVKLTAIIHLKVSKELVLKRLLARGREDDRQDVINRRFQQYDSITTPVLDYLERQGYKIDEVDASKSPEQVEAQVQGVVASK